MIAHCLATDGVVFITVFLIFQILNNTAVSDGYYARYAQVSLQNVPWRTEKHGARLSTGLQVVTICFVYRLPVECY